MAQAERIDRREKIEGKETRQPIGLDLEPLVDAKGLMYARLERSRRTPTKAVLTPITEEKLRSRRKCANF